MLPDCNIIPLFYDDILSKLTITQRFNNVFNLSSMKIQISISVSVVNGYTRLVYLRYDIKALVSTFVIKETDEKGGGIGNYGQDVTQTIIIRA